MSYSLEQEEQTPETTTPDNALGLPAHVLRVMDALKRLGVPAREIEPGWWRAYCPRHENDDAAYLDVKVGDQGQVHLRCRGGNSHGRKCKTHDLIGSLKLKLADLWPETPPEPVRGELAWEPVTPDTPCNVCGGENWCSRLEDGTRELCRRAKESIDGRQGREKKDSSGKPYWTYRNAKGKAPEMFHRGFENRPIKSRLSDKHLADLRKSGLSDKVINAGNFHTQHSPRVTELLGWKESNDSLGNVLIIPYRDALGNFTGYFRGKPDNPRKDKDGKAIKYEAPLGQPPRAYIPAGTVATLKDPTARLIITEGEKKAAKADQEGFPCIGLSGVWSWQKRRPEDPTGQKYGERELIDDLDAIPWKDRSVVIAFDSDAATNDNVLWAEWHLAQVLQARGAVVRIVRLPEGPAGEDGKPAKVGLDDYLVAHGLEGFQKLILEAGLPEDPRYTSPKGHLTDWGNAQRLVEEHGRDLRFCHVWQKWLVWDGARWQIDQTGEAVRRAKQTVARLFKEAANRVSRLQEELDGLKEKDSRREVLEAELGEAEAVKKHAKKSESTARLQAMLVSAQSEPGVPVNPDDLDTDPWLLNVQNGTIDLRTGELRLHRREDLITKLAPVEYDRAADCPVWKGFLGKIMGGNEELIAFLVNGRFKTGH
jgi:hypothetical protein